MHYRRILVLAALTVVPVLVLAAGCASVAEFHNCTREEVKDGGCERCPVTCHDFDDEDAGDAGNSGDSG